MIAEILSTGDELLSGSRIDTNSAYIAEKLDQNGVIVTRHSCVGDDMESLITILKEIGKRSDIAIVTGGLGPTMDDLISDAAARAKGVELLVDPVSLSEINTFILSRSSRYHLHSKFASKQAMFPNGADVIKNSAGTAPGFSLIIGKCIFFFLPGVPCEMKTMLKEKVLPAIDTLYPEKQSLFSRTISVFGLSESEIEDRLETFTEKFSGIKLGLRAVFPHIEVKFKMRGDDDFLLKKHLNDAVAWAVERIGDTVFSERGESMEAVLGRLLSQKKLTVALAESCTGGLIAHRLTAVAGSSNYFLFSGVTYSNEAKMKVLGVRKETLKKFGAVSEQTAGEMADGARKISDATFSISTTGIAGPAGGTPEKPVGTVCIGLSAPDGTIRRRYHFSSVDRIRTQKIFAMRAMDLLRRKLESLPLK
jgi:nicotinamide-nucleotide amidase